MTHSVSDTIGASAADAGHRFPPAAQSWYALGVFFLAAILSYTDRQILNLLVDPIRQDLQISDTQISLLQGAAFAFIYAIAGLPLGRWADRHNRRNLILCGVIIWSMATVACGLATSFSGLFVARMAVGVGEAALAPAVISLLHDLFPPQRRATVIGVFLAGMVMGVGTAIAIGGLLLNAFTEGSLAFLPVVGDMTPWRAVLIMLGVPGLVVALLFLTIREPARDRSEHGPQGADASLAEVIRHAQRNRRTFICLFGGLALATTAEYSLHAWLPSLLMRKHHLTPAEVGTYLGGATMLAGGFGTLLGGIVADALQRSGRKDGRILVMLAAMAVSVPALCFPLLGDMKAVILLFAGYTLLSAMTTTAAIAAVQEVVPNTMRGVAASMVAFMNTFFGLGLGPTLVAFVTDHLYRDPAAIDRSMVTVTVPLLSTTVLLLLIGLPAFRRSRAAVQAGRAG